MDYGKFQVAVVELADEGVRLTSANVVARLRITPEEADRHLARMAREDKLEIDLDDDEGVRAYRVRGLSPRGGRGGDALSSLKEAAVGAVLADRVGSIFRFDKPMQRGGAPLPPSLRRSVPRGVALGLIPGIGLAYAAPWPIVVVGTLAVVIGFKVLAWVSLLFAVPFLVAASVLSGILGGLYTWQYNQMGRRAPLGEDPDPDGSRKLPTRIRF